MTSSPWTSDSEPRRSSRRSSRRATGAASRCCWTSSQPCGVRLPLPRGSEDEGMVRTEGAGTCGQDDVTSCVAGLPDSRPSCRGRRLPDEGADRVGEALRRRRVPPGHGQAHGPLLLEGAPQAHREALGKGLLLGEVGGRRERPGSVVRRGRDRRRLRFSFSGSVVGGCWAAAEPSPSRYLQSRDKGQGYLVSHFLSSHDVTGALKLLNGDLALFRLAALLQRPRAASDDHYGEEVARPGGDWPENRSDMPWGHARPPGAGGPRRGPPRRLQEAIDIRRGIPPSRMSALGDRHRRDLYAFSGATESKECDSNQQRKNKRKKMTKKIKKEQRRGAGCRRAS